MPRTIHSPTTGASADTNSVENVGDVAEASQRLTTYGNHAYALRVLTRANNVIDLLPS